MLYLPLKFGLVYLVLGVVYFSLGPIDYRVDNKLSFYFYLCIYFSFAIFGYLIGIFVSKRIRINKKQKIFRVNFWFFALIAFIADVVFNLVLVKQGVIPYNIFEFIVNVVSLDIASLGNSYYESKLISENFSGNPLASVLLLVFGWARFIFLPYVIWNWSNLSQIQKYTSIIIIIFPVLSGLSVGTNKPIFDVALIFFFSSVFIYLIRKHHREQIEADRLKKLLSKTLLILGLAIVLFGTAMNSRGVTFEYIESNSVGGNISVSPSIPENGLTVSMLMLGHYVFQGYYGFSLSLKEDFDSTYGFGHSPFLSRQYHRVTGEDISLSTYQAKINHEWAQGVRWHSAFAQFANDVHFIGVIIVMFATFFMIALSWSLALNQRIREMIYFLPIHGMFIIFLPANNQVFGFLDSLFLVFLITALFLYRAFKHKA